MNKKIINYMAVFLLVLQTVSGCFFQTAAQAAEDTNQQRVYAYLTGNLGFNAAAACGIMANIERESEFRPDAGDRFYGLFQWGGERKSELIRYCEENGYDYTTIEGQMKYLEYELSTGYETVRTHLLEVENSAEGAYEAGYYWCYYFEAPGDIENASDSRGTLARDQYWPAYNPAVVLPFRSWIDSPKEGESCSKTVMIRGWAICGLEITGVTAYVNENEKPLHAVFEQRDDVAEAFPGYPRGQEGFFTYIPVSDLNDGENTVTIYANCREAQYLVGQVSFFFSEPDLTPPVLENAVITDVTENGYTVTCTVQDESGIDRVQFPTWTEENGQDDLDPDWQHSAFSRGEISEGTVTYRVKTVDHSYGSGRYLTHIYAYDHAGNFQVACVECIVPERQVYFGSVVSKDHAVTSEDALAVLKFVVKLSEPDEYQAIAADVDGDGAITSADALLILKRVVKLTDRFPVEE